MMSKMAILSTMIMMKMTKNPNPISMAIAILILSILTTPMLFKSSGSSWIAFITIMTFSSGMMTLFMYTASLSANEKNKTKKSYGILALPLIFILQSNENCSPYMKESMKTFSMKTTMIFMMLFILVAMLAISSHGHHPNQTLSSSF